MPSPPKISEIEKRLAKNNARILEPNLDNGRELSAERTRIYLDVLEKWGADCAADFPRPFAVAVRTMSCDSTSSIEERIIRAISAAG